MFNYRPSNELTTRENEVIRLVADGLSNKLIAAMLEISPDTVKFHLINIGKKMGYSTRTGAACAALRRGLIT